MAALWLPKPVELPPASRLVAGGTLLLRGHLATTRSARTPTLLEMATTDHGAESSLVLTGPLARWIRERAVAEGRDEADVVAEAMAIRWGRKLGDAYQRLWQAGPGLDDAKAEELVNEEIYDPRQRRRRQD